MERYYDNKGLPKREEEIGGVVKSHTYDGNGNRTGFQLKRSNVVEISLGYAYDKLNRMEKVTRNGAALASYTYTPNGSRASLTYTGSGTSMVTTYGYNYANLVTSLVNKRGSSTLSSFSYAYYRDGNRRSKTETVGGKAARTTSYAYDNLGRLTGEEQAGQYKHAYTYDRYSNRATLTATETGKTQGVTSYAYDQRNRLLTETKEQGGETEIYRYAYDYNGNLRRRDWERFRTAQASKKGSVKLDRGTNGGIVFREQREYDGFDQLVKLTRDGNATTYLYRTDGLRHSKSGDGGTVHIWDGQNLVTDYRGNGVIKARYLRGLGLIAQQIDGNLYFYCFNGHGDVVQRTDAAGGVLNSYEYDAFGNEREPDTVNVNPFRYCGEYWDGESETYYLRARYYDPRTARMLSEDLIRAIYHEMQNGQTLLDPLSLNLYTYCKNNPLKYKDSTGLTPTESEIIEFFYNEYFANYFDTIERFYESFQHDINKFFDAISFDVSGGYYSGDPSAYGQSLYYEAKGLNFRNGINIINAEAGISKIGGDYELLGWNLNSLVGDLALGVGTEFSGFKVGARLFGAGGEVKVSLPFTEKKLIIGVEGELFAVGFNSYYDSTANKFKIGGSLLVGGNLVFGLN